MKYKKGTVIQEKKIHNNEGKENMKDEIKTR